MISGNYKDFFHKLLFNCINPRFIIIIFLNVLSTIATFNNSLSQSLYFLRVFFHLSLSFSLSLSPSLSLYLYLYLHRSNNNTTNSRNFTHGFYSEFISSFIKRLRRTVKFHVFFFIFCFCLLVSRCPLLKAQGFALELGHLP